MTVIKPPTNKSPNSWHMPKLNRSLQDDECGALARQATLEGLGKSQRQGKRAEASKSSRSRLCSMAGGIGRVKSVVNQGLCGMNRPGARRVQGLGALLVGAAAGSSQAKGALRNKTSPKSYRSRSDRQTSVSLRSQAAECDPAWDASTVQ